MTNKKDIDPFAPQPPTNAVLLNAMFNEKTIPTELVKQNWAAIYAERENFSQGDIEVFADLLDLRFDKLLYSIHTGTDNGKMELRQVDELALTGAEEWMTKGIRHFIEECWNMMMEGRNPYVGSESEQE